MVLLEVFVNVLLLKQVSISGYHSVDNRLKGQAAAIEREILLLLATGSVFTNHMYAAFSFFPPNSSFHSFWVMKRRSFECCFFPMTKNVPTNRSQHTQITLSCPTAPIDASMSHPFHPVALWQTPSGTHCSVPRCEREGTVTLRFFRKAMCFSSSRWGFLGNDHSILFRTLLSRCGPSCVPNHYDREALLPSTIRPVPSIASAVAPDCRVLPPLNKSSNHLHFPPSKKVCRTYGVLGSSITHRVPRSLSCSAMVASSHVTCFFLG